jgi:hypothetical protein
MQKVLRQHFLKKKKDTEVDAPVQDVGEEAEEENKSMSYLERHWLFGVYPREEDKWGGVRPKLAGRCDTGDGTIYIKILRRTGSYIMCQYIT